MRIHSDKLSAMHMINALTAEKMADRIAFSVRFKVIQKKGSRTHANAFEIQLATSEYDGPGRRLTNSGGYGAGEDYAATYDEWGFLLEALYALDEEMVVGRVNAPLYADVDDFHVATGFTYSPALLSFLDGPHDSYDPYPFQRGRAGKGRTGFGRITGDEPYTRGEFDKAVARWNEGAKTGNDYLRYVPRTADSVRKFLKLETVAA